MDIIEALSRGPARYPSERLQFRACAKIKSHTLHKEVDIDGEGNAKLYKAAEIDHRTVFAYPEPLSIEVNTGMFNGTKELLRTELSGVISKSRMSLYTPDLAVIQRGNVVKFYEQKAPDYIDVWDEKLLRAKAWLERYGSSLTVVSSNYIRLTALQWNVGPLHDLKDPRVRARYDTVDREELVRLLERQGETMSLKAVADELRVSQISVLFPLLDGVIATDLFKYELNDATPIWVAKDKSHLKLIP
ncbi:MAG: hypothetical protein RIB49_15705 [Rhodospirillales bacterium]